jgi:hypothetical protein
MVVFSGCLVFKCYFSDTLLSRLEGLCVWLGVHRSQRGTREYPGQLSQQHIIYLALDTLHGRYPRVGDPETWGIRNRFSTRTIDCHHSTNLKCRVKCMLAMKRMCDVLILT